MVETSKFTPLKSYKQHTRPPRGLTDSDVVDFLTLLLAVVKEYESHVGETLMTKQPKWEYIHARMCEHFPNLAISIEGLRSHYRRLYDVRMHQICKRKDDKRVGKKYNKSLVDSVKTKKTVAYLAERYGKTEDEILSDIARLQINGYTNLKVWKDGDNIFVHNRGKQVVENNYFDLKERFKGAKEITFAVIGDTHMGSEFCDEDALHHFYDMCAERGISTVFHAGDLTEGFNPRRVHTFLKNRAIGFDAQREYTISNYPLREGITTYVISGNHDNWYQEHGMANIVKAITDVRSDMVYLGDDFARINITKKVTLALVHPNDGSSADIFSKLQNHIERTANDRLATINVLGHYHKVGWIKHRGVYGLYPASFQKESNFMKMNNLRSYVGGYFLTLTVDRSGELIGLHTEFVDYDM